MVSQLCCNAVKFFNIFKKSYFVIEKFFHNKQSFHAMSLLSSIKLNLLSLSYKQIGAQADQVCSALYSLPATPKQSKQFRPDLQDSL